MMPVSREESHITDGRLNRHGVVDRDVVGAVAGHIGIIVN